MENPFTNDQELKRLRIFGADVIPDFEIANNFGAVHIVDDDDNSGFGFDDPNNTSSVVTEKLVSTVFDLFPVEIQ